MANLMGRTSCIPVAEKGVYAVYVKADVEALMEQNADLRRKLREEIHEKAELYEEIIRREMEQWKS